jgi:multisubunit Na+/H+ antiporter MnhB subunit
VIQRTGGWLAAALAFGVLSWALLDLPAHPTGLAREAHRSLDQSGVSNPVTAVLLNYRGYDTLLEVAVLLLAIVAVWSLRSMPTSSVAEPASPMLTALLRLLLPLLLLTSGYLLWIGAFAPGGAFQGGALLGGAIVLTLLGGGFGRRLWLRRGLLRAGLWTGLAVFVGVGLGSMLRGGRFLEYPDGHAGNLILIVEIAALVSIGLTLGALFFGGRPAPESDPSPTTDP